MAIPFHIAIATAGRPELLARTLASLADCRLPSGFSGTRIVENGKRCGAEEVVRRCDPRLQATYLYEPNGNKSLALNRLLDTIDDGFVFYTDDDVRLAPDTLCAYAAAVAAAPPQTFFGGPTRVDYQTPPSDWLRPYLPASAKGWDGPCEEVTGEMTFLGFNWGAFARDVKKLGGFDPMFGPGAASGSVGQETDIQQRLLSNGHQIHFVRDAVVWHYVPADRCSQEWTLQRAYRVGLNYGLRKKASLRTEALLIKKVALNGFKCFLGRMGIEEPRRFKRQVRYWRTRGMLNGVRTQKRLAANGESRNVPADSEHSSHAKAVGRRSGTSVPCAARHPGESK